MEPLWSKKGKFIGWRIGDQLFSSYGYHVGQFPTQRNSTTVYDTNGLFLGFQIDNRLLSQVSIAKSKIGLPFKPIQERIPLGAPFSNIPPMSSHFDAYQDFPDIEVPQKNVHNFEDQPQRNRAVSQFYSLIAFVKRWVKTNWLKLVVISDNILFETVYFYSSRCWKCKLHIFAIKKVTRLQSTHESWLGNTKCTKEGCNYFICAFCGSCLHDYINFSNGIIETRWVEIKPLVGIWRNKLDSNYEF